MEPNSAERDVERHVDPDVARDVDRDAAIHTYLQGELRRGREGRAMYEHGKASEQLFHSTPADIPEPPPNHKELKRKAMGQ